MTSPGASSSTAAAPLVLGLSAAAALAAYVYYRRRDAGPPGTAHTVTRELGKRSGLRVTVLGQGGASLGDLYTQLKDVDALATLEAAHQCGINFFDTAPWYGVGKSEARFGLALHRMPRSSFVLQTKVGRFLVPDPEAGNGTSCGWPQGYHFTPIHDYSAAAIERQMQDSLQRTGLGRIDSLVIHDLEPGAAGGAFGAEGKHDGLANARRHLGVLQADGFRGLQALRAAGTIRTIGAGVNSDENGEDAAVKRAWNREYVDALLSLGPGGGSAHGIDFLLCANLYSLLNHEAHDEKILDKCLAAGVGVVVGGPYSSGILATGSKGPGGGRPPMYNYEPAGEEVLARTRRIEAVCARHAVPLIAAALQFPLGHPAASRPVERAPAPALGPPLRRRALPRSDDESYRASECGGCRGDP